MAAFRLALMIHRGREEHKKRRREERELFVREWGVQAPEPGSPLDNAFTIGVTQWARCRRNSETTKYRFAAAQIVAPIAAGIATVLASTGISRWAVIPSAIATVAASLLASFSFRETWRRLQHMAREVGFEIVQFVERSGAYRDLKDDPARIDWLMKRIEQISIAPIRPDQSQGRPG